MTATELETNRAPRAVWLRIAAFVALLLAAFVLYRWTPLGELLTEERIQSLVVEVRSVWWAPLLLLGLYLVLAPAGLPMTPLIISGAVFGPIFGSVYNLVGLFLGAMASYLLALVLGRDFVIHVAGKRLRRAERVFQRHGFWPLVQTRFLPLPFPVVNFGAALAGVSPSMFLTATVVGLVPSTLLHTYFIATLLETSGGDRAGYLVLYLSSFVVFNLLIGIPWIREQIGRRRRYRTLVADRSERDRLNGGIDR